MDWEREQQVAAERAERAWRRMRRADLMMLGVALSSIIVTGIYATTNKAAASYQEQPVEIRSSRHRPPCTPEGEGMFWYEENPVPSYTRRFSDAWVCNGRIWVETPNAGVEMRQPWAVMVFFAGGNTQVLLFEDGNEADNQARALAGAGLRTIECVAIYYKGDLLHAEPHSCDPRMR